MSKTFPGRQLLLAIAIVSSFGAGYALAAQPHMATALGLLQSARGELQQATHNKGGHRVRAIELIDRAIVQVRAGIADGAD